MFIVIVYLVFLFLILRFCVVLFNYLSKPTLQEAPRKYFDFVSILIPIRNNAGNIVHLLKSIQQQDFENFEVIALDEGSSDHSVQLIKECCKSDSRFRLIKSGELPAGWDEENFAYHQLAKKAKGEYYLFMDGGAEMAPGLLFNALYRMKSNRLSLLSLLPDQKMKSLAEYLLVPMKNYIDLSLTPIRLVLLSKTSFFSLASNQFMMFPAKSYQVFKWHENLGPNEGAEDAIAMFVKSCGLRVETLLANGFISTRKFANLRSVLNGCLKNIASNMVNYPFRVTAYFFITCLGSLLVLPFLNLQLILFGLVLIVGIKLMVSIMGKQPILPNLLLHPLQFLLLMFLYIGAFVRLFSIVLKWNRKRVKLHV